MPNYTLLDHIDETMRAECIGEMKITSLISAHFLEVGGRGNGQNFAVGLNLILKRLLTMPLELRVATIQALNGVLLDFHEAIDANLDPNFERAMEKILAAERTKTSK